jgi:hypothetical protein
MRTLHLKADVIMDILYCAWFLLVSYLYYYFVIISYQYFEPIPSVVRIIQSCLPLISSVIEILSELFVELIILHSYTVLNLGERIRIE